MSDVRHVPEAVVWKSGVPAARLTRSVAGVHFVYLPGYNGPDVSTTLPHGTDITLPGGALPPFFAGLLPEGRRLLALQRAIKASADDELSLLLAVGGDTVGDVTVWAEGQEDVAVEPLVLATDPSSISFSEMLHRKGYDRVGLPGVQDKLSAGMLTLSARTRSGPAILKLDPPDYPKAVENESYFLGMARRLRLPVAETNLVHDREGVPGLLVERFDRLVSDDGSVQSLAVEDACQLLGRYPADKYSMTSEGVASVVASTSAASRVAARSCLQQFALAWLTGNGDLHAKNLSVLQEPSGEWRPSPLYDIPSTLPYGDDTMALPLQGADAGLTRKRFRAFGATLDLPPRATESALEEVLDATAGMLEELSAGALAWNPTVRSRVVRVLRRRRSDMAA